MVVSLGCEKLQPVRLLPSSTLPILAAAPYIVRCRRAAPELRRHGGCDYGVGEKRLVQLNAPPSRNPACVRPGVGLQCGGSDRFRRTAILRWATPQTCWFEQARR